jgi:hypothetical protein
MNYIDKLRADIKRDFNEETFNKGDSKSAESPSKRFRLDATNFWSKEPSWDLTKMEIFNQELNVKLLEFFVNESQFFYGWGSANNIEYLICAEDIFGGQTIVDLTHGKIVGYSPNKDGFIWTDFHLSPDGKTLATIGCYWGWDYVIKIYDFSDPMNLPLKELKEIELLGNDETIIGWINNETLKMKGIKREREREECENGGFRMKILSETEIEREINICSK